MRRMVTEIKNVSSRDSMRIECQKCGCKKVSLQLEPRSCAWENNDLFLVCNHCGHEQWIFSYDPD